MWTGQTCRNDFKFSYGPGSQRLFMEVDAGAAHRSCERDPLSPTQTQQHEAEKDSSTRVHGASGRSARDVAGIGMQQSLTRLGAQVRVKLRDN